MRSIPAIATVLWMGSACGTPTVAPVKAPSTSTDQGTDTAAAPYTIGDRPELIDAGRFYRRVTLDITGSLPDPEDLDLLASDPAELDALILQLLEHPGLEDRVVHLLDEQWHLRYESMPVGPSDYGFDADLRYTLARDMGEEPLRLMARVVAEQQPWDTIVQTDTTMTTPLLTRVWPLEPVSVDEGAWAPTRWTDHRPAVGVLTSNGLWWRYNTTAFNYNRTRASAVARLLLCTDYLALDIEFESPSLVDTEGTEEEIRTNPSCTACHATLDPMSALFFGFWAYDLHDPLELSRYHPEREPLGPVYLQVQPEWFGIPVANLADLARVVPEDARFPICAVQTFSTAMLRNHGEALEPDLQDALLRDFEASDRQVFGLLHSLTRTESYVGDLAVDPPPDSRPRLLGPQQLQTLLEQTLDFDWTYRGEAQLDSDVTGLRVSLGGVDGEQVTAPKRSPDANLALSWRAVSQVAASHAVEQLQTGACALFPGAEVTTSPDHAEFEPALAHAWRWLTATEPTPAQLDALTELWLQASMTDPADGWATVTSALLQDPLVVTY